MIPPPPTSTLFPYTTLFRSYVDRIASTTVGNSKSTASAHTRSTLRQPFFSTRSSARASIASVRSTRSEEHTSELQSRRDLVCRLLLEKKKKTESRSNKICYQ